MAVKQSAYNIGMHEKYKQGKKKFVSLIYQNIFNSVCLREDAYQGACPSDSHIHILQYFEIERVRSNVFTPQAPASF